MTCQNPDEIPVGWKAVEEEERQKRPLTRLCPLCGEFYLPHEADFHKQGFCVK